LGTFDFFGVSQTGDLATWVSTTFTVVTGVAAVFVYVRLRRRDRRQALTDLHVSLTTAETAVARNTIGTLLYSTDRRDTPPRLECIAAYFALIWAIQRARNVFRTFGLPWQSLEAPQSRSRSAISARATKDASQALTWNLVEIAEGVVRFHFEYAEAWSVEDEDAWKEINTYVSADAIRARMQPGSRDAALPKSE